MLYRYKFIKHQKLRELNFHFLYFLRKIKNVKKSARFAPSIFFHDSFLTNGEIAPQGRVNKKLHTGFKAFFDVFKKLDTERRNEFYELIVFSKDIHKYFEDVSIKDIKKIQSSNIKALLNNSETFNQLMDVMWNYLKSPNAWEIDRHYDSFYKNLPTSKMCPFCGLNRISDRFLYRSDYDHIAYKAEFPISSIDLKNITPSCSECNSKFKTTKNVFFAFDDTNRSQFCYPYTFSSTYIDLSITFSLNGSVFPNTDKSDADGFWKITISPGDDITRTWNEIYRIEDRYAELLRINHLQWNEELTHGFGIFPTIECLKQRINSYKDGFTPSKLRIQYHIKYAYYDLLQKSVNTTLLNQINAMIA